MSLYTGPTAPTNEDDIDDLLRKIAKQGTDNATSTSGSATVTQARQRSSAPSNATIGTANGDLFTLAAGDIGFIQNLDDAALAVKKGTGASTTSLHFILGGGTAADDGKGGFVQIDDWIGVVSVAAMAGTARYIAWRQGA